VIVVSPLFEGKSLIEQQRLVYAALADELKAAIHALTLKTVAPSKWQASTANYESPACHGGSKA
jgi:BolA protein